MKKNFTIIGKSGGGSSATGSVRYDVEQQLTTEEKKQALDNLGVDLSAQLKREIVDELPTVGEDNIIYMVARAEAEEQNVYDEYMYINGQWDKIGSTDVDLSDYYTKEESDTAIQGVKETLQDEINTKVDNSTYETKISEIEGVLDGKVNVITLESKSGEKEELNVIKDNPSDYLFNVYNSTVNRYILCSFQSYNENLKMYNYKGSSVYSTSSDAISVCYISLNIIMNGVSIPTYSANLNYESTVPVSSGDKTNWNKKTTMAEVEAKGYLTEHQPLKTINGESIIGEGDLEIKGFSGDYNDLINKPTILNHWFGTQEEYDAIAVKDENTIYHIEGGGIDLDNYYTKTETDTAIQGVKETLQDEINTKVDNDTYEAKINEIEGVLDEKTTMAEVEAKGYTTHDELSTVENKIPTNTEVWTFVLADGTEITKEIYVK